MKDFSPLEHAVIAVAFMTVVGIASGNWLAGVCLGSGIFLGREHAQAEYRWMALHNVKRTGKETLGAFTPAAWNLASVLDFLVPVVACILLGVAVRYFHG